MRTVELKLAEQMASKLEDAAERLCISPEELLLLSLEEKLAQLAEEFRRSADYVLWKNADLYDRLA